MSDNINQYLNSLQDSILYYTASLTPYIQGVELQLPWQISAYTILKIRGNTGFVKTVNGIEKDDQYFDESDVQVTFSDNNQNSSNITLNSTNVISQKLNHQMQKQDFGTSKEFQDGTPFVEFIDIERNSSALLNDTSFYVLSSSLQTSLINKSSITDYDGVIEPFEIRTNIDKKTKNIFGVKGDIGSEDSFDKSQIFSDVDKLLETKVASFFDETKNFGDLDVSALQEKQSYCRFFLETSDREISYLSSSLMLSTSSLTSDLQSLLINGYVSGSNMYKSPNVNFIGTDEVYARRGFIFSQNENYKYDSIAYAGLNRRNRE